MATPTDIVNLGLRRIGADRIGDLSSDTSKSARVARDVYDEARRELLASHNWNFATKRKHLQSTVSADVSDTPTFGWDFAYVLPEDFLRMVSVHPSDSDDASIEYRLEYQEGGDRVLLCNATEVYIRYVHDLEDTVVMSASFRDALAWRLAREFAAALSKSEAAAAGADSSFRRALSRAKAIEGIEDFPDRMAEGDWVSSRFNSNFGD